MAGEVKRIDSIKNMAVFKDFLWASWVKNNKGNIEDFSKINIVYGRNYAGKTTLSRIFRAAETGSISEKFTSPEFRLTIDSGSAITQNSITGHGQIFRVFNEDFVKENLRFIVDENAPIHSFAILGEDNTRIENEITQCETALGKIEDNSGLIGIKINATKLSQSAKKSHDEKSTNLEEKLKNKANKAGTGIKHNKVFGNATYNIDKIKADISTVTLPSYEVCTEEKIDEYFKLLKEEKKANVPLLPGLDLEYLQLVSTSEELIERKIQMSDPILDLVNDSMLEAWVRKGREHHKDKRDKCAFCGSDLPMEIWDKLDKHFNQESENLRTSIDQTLELIRVEKQRIPGLINISSSDFYAQFSVKLENIRKQYKIATVKYVKALEALESQLELRKKEIFVARLFLQPESPIVDITSICQAYDAICKASNEVTTSLTPLQASARTALRLNEVYKFVVDIDYSAERAAIEALRISMEEATRIKNDAESRVDFENIKISQLKAQLKDESKGAERVNEYLNSYFGHKTLTLKAVENLVDGTSSGYRFEITRDGQKAYHMSEGECSLIAFCYFMAKLQDVETKGSEPIIWIDDPISSLDSNHIFFVYSLINAEIVTPEKYAVNGQILDRQKFKQLFISTHNLDFLKYLKRLPGKAQYFIVNRVDQYSHIAAMPRYLQEYVTEFNYLFEQIYKCASIEIVTDENYTTFYNFGNNARKFFEIYLYYKYPDGADERGKLVRFFGEHIPAILTDRINNEYSHLAGRFERGSEPIEAPEMKNSASFILQKIEENDPDQYESLLKSIGVVTT